MTEHPTSFDHGPDPELGAALRTALDAGDDRPFVDRVQAAVDTARLPYWEVLARWARPGIAAAALAAVVAGFLVGRALRRPASLDDAFAATPETLGVPATTLLLSQGPPDAGFVLASVVEQ